MKEKIIVYTSKTCAYCDKIKESLKDSSILFTEIDIVEYKDVWESVWGLTNNQITPTIKVGNEFLLPGRDFQQPQHLIELISNFKESTYSENRRALELVKTLNFNIFSAFQRLQQSLMQIENKLNKEENGNKRNN